MVVSRALETFGYLFYVVSPNRTSFETVEEVPDYTIEVIPWFTALFYLEQIILWRKRMNTFRINDAFGSIANGLLSEMFKLLFRGWKMLTYIYIYNNWRIVTLPWDSLWTWWITFVAVDFFYYWGHRACHEINFFWAAHQVHHSSEDYNLSTALRQSVLQTYFVQLINLPVALVIPPSVFLVHATFNLLYQFWIHTELIRSLGPLEWILNTASHHRVHHGRNRYCIDKNYGGTLIVWDRLFGTFQGEGEEVVYGLTHPVNSFQPIYLQVFHYINIWRTFWATEGWKNKLSVILKGPGWYPGAPWRGNIEDIPHVQSPIVKYDPYLPRWIKLWGFWQFMVFIWMFAEMALSKTIPAHILHGSILYMVFSLTATGCVTNAKMYGPCLEFVRCALYVVMDHYFMPYTSVPHLPEPLQTLVMTVVRATFSVSTLIWFVYTLRHTKVTFHAAGPKKIQ